MITGPIFDWAERTPGKTAIVYNNEPWSYRSFAALIAAARGYFIRHECVGAGVAVLAMQNLMDFWVFSLALRSLGLTTIAARSVEAIDELELSDVRCVVASAKEAWADLDRVCAVRGFSLLSAATDGESAVGLDAISPPIAPGGHILQTSGTTGVYKKVLIDPAFEAAFLHGRRAVNGIAQDSVVNVFCFGAWTGVGYKAAACAWLAGATVVIDQRTAWYEALLYPDVTHATVIPEVLASILAAPDGAFPKSENMRLMITGGTVTQAQIDQAKARITPHLYNSLSSTEVSIFGFTALDSPEDHRWHRPVSGREMQIVDEFDRLMPIGEVGLVRVSTAGGPTHYLDDEEATRAFFKDGFFYPGDLGVIRPDGRFALQGRVTDVINMNGHKISPAPIEDNLREALGVSGVCLFSMQDDHGEEEVHVVIEARTPIDAERLGATLRRELTGFPRACVRYVTALPRNSMGKVLRAAVRTQSRSASLTPEDAGLG